MTSNWYGSGCVTLSYYKYDSTSMKLQVPCQILRVDWAYTNSLGFQTTIYKLYFSQVQFYKYENASMIWQLIGIWESLNLLGKKHWSFTIEDLQLKIYNWRFTIEDL